MRNANVEKSEKTKHQKNVSYTEGNNDKNKISIGPFREIKEFLQKLY